MQPGNGGEAGWWREAKRIFDAALQLAPEKRGAFAERECAGDAALLDEVNSLLANYDATEGFFDDPPAGKLADPMTAMAGKRYGAYRIIRRIGAGGMGMVYLAERADEQFRKLVALKAVRAGLLDARALRRFQNERQALAALDHPHIIKLLDGGTAEDGAPYLVTEYVEGQPIDSYSESHKLTVRERVQLFRKVLDAVHYAHQNLVVHRDLKPGNIFVAADGTPKLLDFGIAKLLRPEYAAHMGLTQTRMQPMTPEFASPEQVLGQPVTTASDIYSLGVVLYRLLTGSNPYDFKTYTPREIEQAVCETDPERPSKFAARQEETRGNAARRGDARLLRGDLDVIVLMAMRKEPQRRYASALHFSEDLRRYLEQRPVEARKAGVWYRASKFIGRHRAAAAMAAMLAAGLMASGAEALRERNAAERWREDLRHFANFVLTGFDTALREGPTEYRNTLAAKGTEYLDALAKERRTGQMRHDLVTGYLAMGDVQGNLYQQSLGNLALAEASYRKALEIAEEEFSLAKDNRDNQLDLSLAHRKLGEVLSANGNGGEAMKHYDEALRLSSMAQPAGATDVDASMGRIAFWMDLGQQRNFASDPEGAREMFGRELEESEKLPATFQYKGRKGERALIAAAARELAAKAAVEAGDPAGADDAIWSAIAVYDAAIAKNPKSGLRRTRAKAYKNLAEARRLAGRNAEALDAVRKSLAMSEELLAQDAKSAQSQLDVEQALMEEITLLEANGLAAEAHAQTVRALAMMHELADAPGAAYQPASDYAELLATTPFADLRDDAAALRYAHKADTQRHGRDPDVLYVLARACERNRDARGAREAADKALALLPPARPGRPKTQLRAALETLEARLPRTPG